MIATMHLALVKLTMHIFQHKKHTSGVTPKGVNTCQVGLNLQHLHLHDVLHQQQQQHRTLRLQVDWLVLNNILIS